MSYFPEHIILVTTFSENSGSSTIAIEFSSRETAVMAVDRINQEGSNPAQFIYRNALYVGEK